jgi:prepilin-type N-terminal cleavage/methylation domain-containing protein
MQTKGFTLVELLVVITIISVLSAIGIVSFQMVLKNGRDARRQSDLGSIQSALEQYHTDQFYYPQTLPAGAFQNDNQSKTYLNMIPRDPQTDSPYCYNALPTNCDNATVTKCNNYEIYAKLENSSSAGSYTCSGVEDYNFKVTPP